MDYREFVRRAATVLALVVAALTFWELRQIFMLVFLSAVIAVSLSIPVNRLQNIGLRRGFAIAATLIGVISAIVLFLLAILPTLVLQVNSLVNEFPEAYNEVRSSYNLWYLQQSDPVRSVLPMLDDEQIQEFLTGAGDAASGVLASAGGVLANIVINLIGLIVISVFLLLDPKDYARGVVLLTPPDYRDRLLEVFVELKGALTSWLTALTFSITITFLLVWVLLGLLWGVPNALALGVIAGLMTIIPNIGAIVPAIPITIFTLADEPAKLPFVLATYILIQQIESNILTPSIVKRQMNIPAALVFIFQLISAALFGFFGILLAVPLLATIITLVRELYVYDTLGQRDVKVDLEYTEHEGFRLITQTPDNLKREYKVLTQTFEVVRAFQHETERPPEDILSDEEPAKQPQIRKPIESPIPNEDDDDDNR